MWESSLKLHKYLVINQLNLSTYFSTSYGVKFSYFIQCFINFSTCYYNYIVVPSLIRWSSFKLALVVFLLVPIFFWPFPCFLVPQDALCLSFINPAQPSHFSKGTWLFWWKMVFRSQFLGDECPNYYWAELLPVHLSRQR